MANSSTSIGPLGAGASWAALYAGKTVLAVGARPGDLELGIGGTLALLSTRGARVVLAAIGAPEAPQTADEECRRAAAALGCEARLLETERCFRLEDAPTYRLAGLIEALLCELEPAALFAHSPRSVDASHHLTFSACVESQSTD